MGSYFHKVFIPNRGVIAVRAIRTLRDLGIGAVVGYSDADRSSLAVRMADEAHRLGPAPSSTSYLAATRIIEAARNAGCDAIFPGYGFLSENADFAEACGDAGLTFIGPPPAVLRRLAHKNSARHTLIEAGFNVLPGTGAISTAGDIHAFAQEVGYPLLIKPVAGAGGLGTARVDGPDEISARLDHARSVATIAFGDETVCAEKLLDHAASISVQFLADSHGNAIHLGEREGSVQRMYGKLVDEAPSAKLAPDGRAAIGEQVAQAMSSLGYVTAGTVEFLLAPPGVLYAIEVNPRIQVEHVVTEMVTGVDLVEQMIRTASGAPLTWRQSDISMRGHAVQCRIKAEDPARAFAPCHGRITQVHLAEAPFVRHDEGIHEGCDVPMYYDSLLLQVGAQGKDRSAAIRRLASSLRDLQIGGVRTNAVIHRRILEHPTFLDGTHDTSFLDRHLQDLLGPERTGGKDEVVGLASLVSETTALGSNPHAH